MCAAAFWRAPHPGVKLDNATVVSISSSTLICLWSSKDKWTSAPEGCSCSHGVIWQSFSGALGRDREYKMMHSVALCILVEWKSTLELVQFGYELYLSHLSTLTCKYTCISSHCFDTTTKCPYMLLHFGSFCGSLVCGSTGFKYVSKSFLQDSRE